MKNTKIIGLFLFLLYQSLFSQMTIYEGYPPEQTYYKGGSVAFYKELRQVLLDTKKDPCNNRTEHYAIPILIKEDATISLIKDENTSEIEKNKCAYELIRFALPYLENWNPAVLNGAKINTIVELDFYPDDLFFGYKESYSGPDDNLIVPEFPGGIDKFRNKVITFVEAKGIKYSEIIHLGFEIDKDGNLINPSILGYEKSEFAQEAVKSLSRINTKWKPATKNGIPISFKFRMPLSIVVEEPKTGYDDYKENDIFQRR